MRQLTPNGVQGKPSELDAFEPLLWHIEALRAAERAHSTRGVGAVGAPRPSLTPTHPMGDDTQGSCQVCTPTRSPRTVEIVIPSRLRLVSCNEMSFTMCGNGLPDSRFPHGTYVGTSASLDVITPD